MYTRIHPNDILFFIHAISTQNQVAIDTIPEILTIRQDVQFWRGAGQA